MADKYNRNEADKALFDGIAANYAAKDRVTSSSLARSSRCLSTLEKAGGVKGKRVLEIGCGAGYGARYIGESYRSYVGLDQSSKLVEFAQKFNWGENRLFECEDFFSYTTSEKFDIVFMIGVLHHMDDVDNALTRSWGLLASGGVLVVNEPSPRNLLISFMREVRKRVDSSYSRDQVELLSDEIVAAMGKAGFIEISSYPQGFVSTPFAEVAMHGNVFVPLVKAACQLDKWIERRGWRQLNAVSWNSVVVGRVP